MTDAVMSWLLVGATFGLVLCYEAFLWLDQVRRPGRLARRVHAQLREEWLLALSDSKGSEVLAVQTLRNALMAATMTASTAAIGLMGTVTLAAPSLLSGFGGEAAQVAHLTPRLAAELMLLVMLFAALVSSTMAVRYYKHVGFIAAMPVGSTARSRWAPAGVTYVRRAGTLYSWALRHLVLVAPVLAFIVYPYAGPVAAMVMVAVLYSFDNAAALD